MRFRKDVQGLRAVAVIPVLLFHFGVSQVPGGFTGVDIFFCISGYVIAGSIAEDIRAARFSIADFYFKRIRRIFPALGATMLLTSIAAAIILLPDDLVSYWESLLATASFWSNIHFWHASGYFQAAAQLQPLLHTWSLSIEEQFYVFAPVGFWLIHRYGRARWLPFLAPVALLSLAASIASVFVAPTAGFFLLTSRAWELLIGAMLALHQNHGPDRRGTRELVALAGVALIAMGLFWLHESDPFPGWNALFPCVGTALVILAGRGTERMPLVNRALSIGPMLWIGNISYSLYLVHWPIAALVRYATLKPPTPWSAAAMFALSVGLATLSYRYVEQPFRHIDRRHRTRILGIGAAMIGAVVGVAALGEWSDGFPGRYPGYKHQEVAGKDDWGGAACFAVDPTHQLPWQASACTRIRGRRGRILLWGDSFAAQYVSGIMRDARRIDADVLQYTFAGCPPILAYTSLARVGCGLSNRAVPALIRRERIDTVVLSARWSETPRRTLLQLHDTVARLRGMGLRVIVFGQSPQFIADVQQIDFVSGQYARGGTVAWPVTFSDELNATVQEQARGAQFVNPIDYLCVAGRCPYRVGRTYLYSDYGHLSRSGSTLAVRKFFPAGR
ncbi:acyltransferase family protein [uncultured Sphingomonas sp.]|uniref:acyltransferase family protein n=1 Tax=uncultured Sphingomonas sp. TaxID=158754 RepID=UPI0035C970F6